MIRSASLGVSRFDGIGRQGLLRLSSSIAAGCRWLSIVKGSRLIQVQNAVVNILWSIVPVGGAELISKIGADIAFKIPNTVLGPMIVFRSLKVKSHIDCR